VKITNFVQRKLWQVNVKVVVFDNLEVQAVKGSV